MATSFSTSPVKAVIESASARTWATGYLSTEALGSTNSDVIDCGGLSVTAIALSTLVSAACTYNIAGGLSSTSCQTIIGSTGNTVSYGSTLVTMQGRTFVVDPAFFAGFRYIRLDSLTTGGAAPNASGATYQVFLAPYGQVK